MNERRLARIQQQIKSRIATALVHELSDPRLGFVTISRVEVDRELHRCTVYWSVLGEAKDQRLTAAALEHATGRLRSQVAKVLHTRTVPKLQFRFDESVAGAERMRKLLDELTSGAKESQDPTDAEDTQPEDGSDLPR